MISRVVAVVTNRASYARIKSALIAIDAHPNLELHLVIGGSAVLERFGNLETVISADGLSVASRCHFSIEGDDPSLMAKSLGLAVIELSSTFLDLDPDFVLTVADRYETLGTAIAASYMNIPLIHTQGGEVTGSIDNKVRDAVTCMADIHFPASERARRRLIEDLGVNQDSVFLVGCPSIDLVMRTELSSSSGMLEELEGVGAELDSSLPYMVVQYHPVTTNFGDARADNEFQALFHAVSELAQDSLQIVWFWPNIDAGGAGLSHQLRMEREKKPDLNIRFVKNLPPERFFRLLNNARCLAGNSSVGVRECAYLGTPTVNIGERQNGRERAENVIDCAPDRVAILEALRSQVSHQKFLPSALYGTGDAGNELASIVASLAQSK